MSGINTPNGQNEVPKIKTPVNLAELVKSMESAEGRQRSALETRAYTGAYEPWKKSAERLAQNPEADIVQERWGSEQEIETEAKRISIKIKGIKLEEREVDGKKVYFIKSPEFKRVMKEGKAEYELKSPEQFISLTELYDGMISNSDRLRILQLMESLSEERDEAKIKEIHSEIANLREVVSERELLSGMVSNYSSSIETYQRVRSEIQGANPDLQLPDDSTAMQHHAVFKGLVSERLRNGIQYEQLLGQMNEVKLRYNAAKENRGVDDKMTKDLKAEFLKLNEGYDALLNEGQTLDQQLVELMQGKQGPGANETGLLPIQKVTLEVIDAEYKSIHEAYKDFERIGAEIRKGKAANADVSNLEKEFAARMVVFSGLNKRGKANVQRKTDVMLQIGRFNIYRAKVSMLKHSFGQVYSVDNLPQGKKFENLTKTEQEKYRGQYLAENAKQSIGDIRNHLSAMLTAVPEVKGNAVAADNEDPNEDAFIDDIADRIARLQGVYSPTGNGMLDATITTFKGDSRDALYTALDWPRDPQTGVPLTIAQMKASNDPKAKAFPEKLKLKMKTMKEVVDQFRSSDAITNLGESVAVSEELMKDEWKPENMSSFDQIDFRDFPPPGTRITVQNMKQLAETHGKKIVYMMAIQQLSTDWERYGMEHDRLMTGMHSVIDVHFQFAAAEEVFRSKAKEVEGIVQVLGTFATGLAVFSSMRYGGAYLRGGLPRLGARLGKDAVGIGKGALAVPRGAVGAGRGLYTVGQRGLAAMRPTGSPMVPARILAQSRTVTSAISKFGPAEQKLLRALLGNSKAIANLNTPAHLARIAKLKDAVKAVNLTRQEAYALQRAISTASKEANAVGKLGGAEAALFKASGGVAREMSLLTASGRVLGVAAMAFQAYMVYDAFDQYGKAKERAGKNKEDVIKQLSDSGFIDGGDGVYRHPDMPGVDINVSNINEGLDAEQNARFADAITAAGGLAAAATITCLATGPASAVLIIGVVVIEIVVHAIIEHYEFKKQKELLAGDHPIPPWLLLAFGTMRTTNKTPNTILDKLDLPRSYKETDTVDEKVAEKMIWLLWCQEAEGSSKELFSQIFCDKQKWNEVDDFYNEEWTRDAGLYAMWRQMLFDNIGGPAALTRYSKLTGRSKQQATRPSASSVGYLLKRSTPLQRRKAMRDTMAAYLPYLKAKRFMKMKKKFDANPMGKVEFGENELHLETVMELFGEEKILGKKVRDFTEDELIELARNPKAILSKVQSTSQLYQFIENPVVRMQLLDLHEQDEDSKDFVGLDQRTDIRYAVNSIVRETNGIPDFGRGMSIWQHAVTSENAGSVYDTDPVRKGEQKLTDVLSYLTRKSKSRDDELAKRLFGRSGQEFDPATAPLALQHVRFGGEIQDAKTKEVNDRGPNQELANKWHLDMTRAMLEAVKADYPEFREENLQAVILTGEPYSEQKRWNDPALFSKDKKYYTQFNYAGNVRLIFRKGNETFALDQGFLAYRNRQVHSSPIQTDWAKCHIVKGALQARPYTEVTLTDVDSQLAHKVTGDLIAKSNKKYEAVAFDEDNTENFKRRTELESEILGNLREPPLLLISEGNDVLKKGSDTYAAAIELCRRLVDDGRSQWSMNGAIFIELKKRDDGALSALATYVRDQGADVGEGQFISRNGAVAERTDDEQNPWYYTEGKPIGHIRQGDDINRSMWLWDVQSIKARYAESGDIVNSLNQDQVIVLSDKFNGTIAHVMAENSLVSTDEIPNGKFLYVRATDEYLMVDESNAFNSTKIAFKSRESLYDPRESRFRVVLKCAHESGTSYKALAIALPKIPANLDQLSAKDKKTIDDATISLQKRYPGATIGKMFMEFSPRGEFDTFTLSSNVSDGFNPNIAVHSASELMNRTDLSSEERDKVLDLYFEPLESPEKTLKRILDLFSAEVRADGTSVKDIVVKALAPKLALMPEQSVYLRSLFYMLLEERWLSDAAAQKIIESFGYKATLPSSGSEKRIALVNSYALRQTTRGLFEVFGPDGKPINQDNSKVILKNKGVEIPKQEFGVTPDMQKVIAASKEGNLTISVTGPSGMKLMEDVSIAMNPTDIRLEENPYGELLSKVSENEWTDLSVTLKQSAGSYDGRWVNEGKYTSGYSYARTLYFEAGDETVSFTHFDSLRFSPPIDALESAISSMTDGDTKKDIEKKFVELKRMLLDAQTAVEAGENIDVHTFAHIRKMQATPNIPKQVRLLLSEVNDELSGASRQKMVRNFLTTPEAESYPPATSAFERPVRRITDMFLWKTYTADRGQVISKMCALYHKFPNNRAEILKDIMNGLSKASDNELKKREEAARANGDKLTRAEREVGVIDGEGIDGVIADLDKKYGSSFDALKEYEALLKNTDEYKNRIKWITPVSNAKKDRNFQVVSPFTAKDAVPGEEEDNAELEEGYFARFESGLGYIFIAQGQSKIEPNRVDQFKKLPQGYYASGGEGGFKYGRVQSTEFMRDGIRWNEIHNLNFAFGNSGTAKQARFALTTPMPIGSNDELHLRSIQQIADLCGFTVSQDESGVLKNFKQELIGSPDDPDSLIGMYLRTFDKQRFLNGLLDAIKQSQVVLPADDVVKVGDLYDSAKNEVEFRTSLSDLKLSKPIEGKVISAYTRTTSKEDFVSLLTKVSSDLTPNTVPNILLLMRQGMLNDTFVTPLKKELTSERITLADGYYIESYPHTIRSQKGIKVSLKRKDNKPVEAELVIGTTTSYVYRNILNKPDELWLSMDDYKDFGMYVSVRTKADTPVILLDKMPVVVEGAEQERAEYKNEVFRKSFMADVRLLDTEAQKEQPDIGIIEDAISKINRNISSVTFKNATQAQEFEKFFRPYASQDHMRVGSPRVAIVRLLSPKGPLELASVATIKSEVHRLRAFAVSGGVEQDKLSEIVDKMNASIDDLEKTFLPERYELDEKCFSEPVGDTGHFLRFDSTSRRYMLAFAPFEKLPSLPAKLSTSYSLSENQVVDIDHVDESKKSTTIRIQAKKGQDEKLELAYDKAACEKMGVALTPVAGPDGSVRFTLVVNTSQKGTFKFSRRKNATSEIQSSVEFVTKAQLEELDFAKEDSDKWIGSGGDMHYLCHKDESGKFAYYRWSTAWNAGGKSRPERLLPGSLSWKEAPEKELPILPTLPA